MKKVQIATALLALGVLLIAGCSSSDEDATAAVEEIYAEYEAAWLAGDADAWIALWSDDPVVQWPGFPTISGSDAMLAAAQEDLSVVRYTEFEIFADEVETMGEWAFALGTFRYVFEVKDTGESAEFNGKYQTIFQQQSDGSWLIHRDASSSNVP